MTPLRFRVSNPDEKAMIWFPETERSRFLAYIDAYPRMQVMQSTGLIDLAGKEMYESDICEWTSDEGDKERYLIVWNSEEACFEFELIGRDIPNSEIDTDVAVIGNRFQNPDLLPQAE